MISSQLEFLQDKCKWIREKSVSIANKLGDGRISSSLSHVEILVSLYYSGCLNTDFSDANRDRVVLSKGHGVISLYSIFADKGFFPIEDLDNLGNKDSLLSIEPNIHVNGIECLTGSLGHGLPIATGMAIGLNSKVFCILGDCELYEGANWESFFLIGALQLKNLVCIIDNNKQGVLGYSDVKKTAMDPPSIEPLEDKFKAFNINTKRINGHDIEQIITSIQKTGPLVIIADTVKGKGVPELEGKRNCHYYVPKGV